MSRKLFQITVADEQGVVIDTGWVAMEIPRVPAMSPSGDMPLAGAALYDAVLEYGLDNGIMADQSGAIAAGS
jgi:hypothetical protein